MSYIEHFGLKEQAFRLTPDPDFVYWSKQHARAKSYMESTIWLSDGFVVITGEIGSGKTTLLQSFLNELGEDVVFAVVSQTQLSSTQFLQAILTEFGFKPFKKRKVELLDLLNMFLIEQYGNGKKVLLLIDEAQNLDSKVLEEVRMLSGIETHKEKVLRIILAGQPELRDTLEKPGLKQLMQRVRLRFHLGPLDQHELREYIGHRLEVAGCENPDLFAEEVFDVIYEYSGGIPRLVNTLCDTAMLCAFAENNDHIGLADVESAIEELDWKPHQQLLPGGTSTPTERSDAVVAARPHSRGPVTRIDVICRKEIIDTFELDHGRAIIGRAPDSEVAINSKYVSRHHAQLISDDSGCIVEDLNSTNGLVIGDHRIKRYRLRHHDVIRIGEHELLYSDVRDDGDTKTRDESPTDEFEALVAHGEEANDDGPSEPTEQDSQSDEEMLSGT